MQDYKKHEKSCFESEIPRVASRIRTSRVYSGDLQSPVPGTSREEVEREEDASELLFFLLGI